jgi:hypothetical protein
MTFDWEGCEPRHVRPLETELRRLARQYPTVAAAVHTVRGSGPKGWQKAEDGRPYAGYAGTEGVIEFNRHYIGVGRSGLSEPKELARHEFGHVVARALGLTVQSMGGAGRWEDWADSWAESAAFRRRIARRLAAKAEAAGG